MENYLWILILVLVVAPFVLLLWAIHTYRRWRNRRAEEAKKKAERDRAILAGEIKSTPEEIAAAERASSGFSFPLGVPIVVIVLL
ncbi:MAG: hypothetical protein HY046_03610 [Acidobacteria bacterium]|nr:hypothetical protein [Acidobacteriota bacterium]